MTSSRLSVVLRTTSARSAFPLTRSCASTLAFGLAWSRNVAPPCGSRSHSSVRYFREALHARLTAAEVFPTPPLTLYAAMILTRLPDAVGPGPSVSTPRVAGPRSRSAQGVVGQSPAYPWPEQSEALLVLALTVDLDPVQQTERKPRAAVDLGAGRELAQCLLRNGGVMQVSEQVRGSRQGLSPPARTLAEDGGGGLRGVSRSLGQDARSVPLRCRAARRQPRNGLGELARRLPHEWREGLAGRLIRGAGEPGVAGRLDKVGEQAQVPFAAKLAVRIRPGGLEALTQPRVDHADGALTILRG